MRNEPKVGDTRERWGHVERYDKHDSFDRGPRWARIGDTPTVGARRVEIDFESFSYTRPIAFHLSANERVVGVTQSGEYRNVWIEREVPDA